MTKDQHIRVLPDHVINKIAAGEVVERPASVLKELIENALDADATQIDVAVAAGGRNLVSVSDNGAGMGRDDALLSIERHATSKIRDVDDIEHIATLGFRGEALAAIAAVSRFALFTRRAGDLAGTEIQMTGGKIQDVRDAGCPPGTAVEVRNLFFNVPARRKFLRSEQTELAHLRQTFIVYALAHPQAGLTLTVDGRKVFTLPAQAALPDRLHDLYASVADLAIKPVNFTAGEIGVSGYVSLPANSRGDRSEQYLFINGRPAGAPVLSLAIREGYHSLLPRDRFPVVFLFLALPPNLVDVNVHPTKKEVRFHNPAAVRDALIEAIRRALGSPPATTKPALNLTAAASPGPGFRPAQPLISGLDKTRPSGRFPYPSPLLAAPGAAKTTATVMALGTTPSTKTETAPGTQLRPKGFDGQAQLRPGGFDGQATAAASESPWQWCRILGQVGGLYVVMETEDGLVLMDPHAAHERVLYEQFLSVVSQGRTASQALLLAETVELPPADALRVRRHLDLLKKMGFGIAEFGGDTFVVDALPAGFAGVPPRVLLADLATALEEAGERRGAQRLIEEHVARAACRAAVKAHGRLTPAEIEDLVAQLARAEMPYTCPHGRPTLIHTSFQELGKRFGRQ